jgi:hypothetical protein
MSGARAAVWNAPYIHIQAFADRSLPDLPLQTVARVYPGALPAVKDAAELFSAMGVMRDMPLQGMHSRRAWSATQRTEATRRLAAHRRGLAGYRAAGSGGGGAEWISVALRGGEARQASCAEAVKGLLRSSAMTQSRGRSWTSP